MFRKALSMCHMCLVVQTSLDVCLIQEAYVLYGLLFEIMFYFVIAPKFNVPWNKMVGRRLLGVCLFSEAMLNVKSLYSTLGVTIYLFSPKNTETIDNPSVAKFWRQFMTKWAEDRCNNWRVLCQGFSVVKTEKHGQRKMPLWSEHHGIQQPNIM